MHVYIGYTPIINNTVFPVSDVTTDIQTTVHTTTTISYYSSSLEHTTSDSPTKQSTPSSEHTTSDSLNEQSTPSSEHITSDSLNTLSTASSEHTTSVPVQSSTEPESHSNTPDIGGTVTVDQCTCACYNSATKRIYLIGINYTQSELKEAMKGDLENLEKLLLIDKNTTSAAIRRRTSAHDNRNSSIAIGTVAIIIICFVVFFIIFIDCGTKACTKIRYIFPGSK